MEPTKKVNGNDEIDLVELLGVVLKWRRPIIAIVIAITILAVTGLSINEHYRFSPKYFGEVKQDVFFATNNFFNKKTDLNKYKKFITTLLFPASINTPKFEVNVSDGSNLYYLFETEKGKELFMNKYNMFTETMYNLLKSKNNVSGLLAENCKKFFSTTQFGSPKDISLFFDDINDIKKCNEYNYYNSLVQDRFAYASEATIAIGDTYMDFLSDFMDSHPELNKINAIQDSRNSININFNVKKVIKYTAVAFIISIILGIFSAFILEFWSVNKKRINGYLK